MSLLSVEMVFEANIVREQFSPRLYQVIRRLMEDEGGVKVRSTIQATQLPQNVLLLAEQYTSVCAAFRGTGADV